MKSAVPPRHLSAAESKTSISSAEMFLADSQRRLAELGFYPGLVDGIARPRTRSALEAFQEVRRIFVSGNVDDATRLELQR